MTVFCLYARKSLEDKQPNSIGIQRDWGQRTCRANGWVYGEEYIDEGQKSWVLNRPNLKRLIEDIVARRADRIGVHNHDRLARGPIFYTLMDLLVAYDVRITFGDLPETLGDAASMVRGFLVGYDQYFLERVHTRTKEALQKKMEEKVRVGAPVKGFAWDKGDWLPEQWTKDMVDEVRQTSALAVAQHRKYPAKSVRAINRIIHYYTEFEKDGQVALKQAIAKSTRGSYDRMNIVEERKAKEEEAFRNWLVEHTPIRPVLR
jgi:DNA invertase Pin-like site-specific DNA recombinase